MEFRTDPSHALTWPWGCTGRTDGWWGGPSSVEGASGPPTGPFWTWKRGKGPSPPYSGCLRHRAQVEVDEDTGEVRLLRLTAAHDVGKAINPDGCTAQIEGALGQGLGIALFEEMDVREGVVSNPNLIDYKIPSTLDMPLLTPLIVEEAHPEGPFGAKGVGEPGLAPTAAAIANAVYDAIGIQCKSLPFTPERILGVLQGRTDPAE